MGCAEDEFQATDPRHDHHQCCCMAGPCTQSRRSNALPIILACMLTEAPLPAVAALNPRRRVILAKHNHSGKLTVVKLIPKGLLIANNLVRADDISTICLLLLFQPKHRRLMLKL